MSKRESGSVMLAFAGFAVLVLTFKGTWGNMFGALIGHKKTSAAAAGGGVAASSGQLAYPVSAGTLAFAGVTSGRPGQAPLPATAVRRGPTAADRAARPPHPLMSSAHGDRAGAPGENRFTLSSADQNKYWAFHGGWQGPGVYEAQKFTDPSHGYTTGTELVKVG